MQSKFTLPVAAVAAAAAKKRKMMKLSRYRQGENM